MSVQTSDPVGPPSGGSAQSRGQRPATLATLLSTASLGLKLRFPTGQAAQTAAEKHALRLSRTPLRWGYSTDLTDPTPFLSGRELILTTGQQLQSSSHLPETCQDYATRLVAHGVCGLLFTLAKPDPQLTEALWASCAAVGLPLVEAPYETPYVQISEMIADAGRTTSDSHEVAQLHAQHALTLAALDRHPIPALIRELGMLLGVSVTLIHPDGNQVVATPKAPHPSSLRDELDDAVIRFQHARRPAPIRMRSGAVAAPILAEGALCGVLCLTVPPRARTEVPRSGLTLNTAISMLQLAWPRLEQEHHSSVIDDEVLQLVLDRNVHRAQLLSATQPGGSLPDRVGLVLVSHGEPLPSGTLVQRSTEHETLGLFPPGELPHPRTPSAGHTTVLCANVPLEWVADAVAGMRAAREAPHTSAQAPLPGRVLTLESPRAEIVLRSIREQPESAQLLATIRQTLATNCSPQTTQSLERVVAAWCDAACSASAAATTLGVHRTTVTRSLQHYQAVTGLDLTTAGDRLLAWAVCRTII